MIEKDPIRHNDLQFLKDKNKKHFNSFFLSNDITK